MGLGTGSRDLRSLSFAISPVLVNGMTLVPVNKGQDEEKKLGIIKDAGLGKPDSSKIRPKLFDPMYGKLGRVIG